MDATSSLLAGGWAAAGGARMQGMSQPGLEPAFLYSCANLQGFAFAVSTSTLSHLEKSCHVNSLSEHCFHISPA